MARAAAALCLVAAAAASVVVHADAADHIQLEYYAPPGCPRRSDVLAAIEHQLGPAFRTETELTAQARVIEHADDDFELIISYSASSGAHDRRSMHSESCKAAAEAAALLLSLALVPTPPAPPAAASRTETHNEIALLGRGESAILPGFALGAGIQAGVRVGHLRVGLSAAQFAPQDLLAGNLSGQLELWMVSLDACYLALFQDFELGPCAGAEIGRLGAYAAGAANARPGAARVQVFDVGGHFRVRIATPAWLFIDLGLAWIQRRPQFAVADYGVLFQPGRFGFRLGFGPLLIW